MLLGRPWIHDTEAVPSSLYQKVRFPHERAIVTIYGDTLTIPKPIFGIDFEELLTLDGFEIEKPGARRREVEVEKIPMEFSPYSNNNVVAMMRRMARAKAKAKGLSCSSEPLKPYTPTLNRKFVKAGDSQCY